MNGDGIAFRQKVALAVALLLTVSTAARTQSAEVDAYIAEAPSAVFASATVGDAEVILLTHQDSLESTGVVYGDVFALAYRSDSDHYDWHRGHLYSDHAPGFASESEFVFQMYNPVTYKSELVYFSLESNAFRIYQVPARFIGRMAIWNGKIFYSTEIYDNTIHCVSLDDGEIHFIEGSGELFSNTDFWIIGEELIVTEYGDRGTPYRLDTEGLYPAPDVTVSPETKVGFNLRTIRDGEGLERFEELLGIR